MSPRDMPLIRDGAGMRAKDFVIICRKVPEPPGHDIFSFRARFISYAAPHFARAVAGLKSGGHARPSPIIAAGAAAYHLLRPVTARAPAAAMLVLHGPRSRWLSIAAMRMRYMVHDFCSARTPV